MITVIQIIGRDKDTVTFSIIPATGVIIHLLTVNFSMRKLRHVNLENIAEEY